MIRNPFKNHAGPWVLWLVTATFAAWLYTDMHHVNRVVGFAATVDYPVSPVETGRLSSVAVEVGQPVRVDTPRGIFLLRVAGEVDAGIKEFEEVRPRLSRKLHEAAMQRELELWTAEQRRRAHVEVFL